MASKFYAVKKGSLTGIFRTWEECKACVDGYPGPVYKSFPTLEEAGIFMGWISPAESVLKAEGKETGSGIGSMGSRPGMEAAGTDSCLRAQDPEAVAVYVDGSFHSATGEFSYGMVVLKDGAEETFSKKFDDPELAAMHNVAGEIKGAEAAMQYALDRELPAIVIYHDYEGIAKWCTGQWKTNKDGTKAYKAFYENASRKVKISFVKVTGHSGNKYNDMADKLAKEALGIL